MAREVIYVCDMHGPKCKGEVQAWRIIPPGGKQARVVDLCHIHGAPMVDAVAVSKVTEQLPPRPKRMMAKTPLVKA